MYDCIRNHYNVVYKNHFSQEECCLFHRLDGWRMLLDGTTLIPGMDAGCLVLMFQPKCSTSSFRSPSWQLLLILQGLFLLEKLRLELSGHTLKDISLLMILSLSIRPFLLIRLKTLVCTVNRFLCNSNNVFFFFFKNACPLTVGNFCCMFFCSIMHWISLISSPLLIATSWICYGTSIG